MAPRILVVDRNEAFATMLCELLEIDGGYHVKVAQTGSDALTLLAQADYALTIVDMDLDPEDMSYRELIQYVRQMRPTMRVMLIPLMGKDLPPDVAGLDLQGMLSKPFFADDLLPSIQDVLLKEVSSSAPQPVAPSPPPEPVEQMDSDVQPLLAELARETRADAILLISYASGRGDVVAHFSVLDKASVETLASLLLEIVSAAQGAAQFLGQPNRPFEHNMFEGESLRLYAMTLPQSLMLVVVAPVSTPLGTIRHNLRRAGRSLADRALT